MCNMAHLLSLSQDTLFDATILHLQVRVPNLPLIQCLIYYCAIGLRPTAPHGTLPLLLDATLYPANPAGKRGYRGIPVVRHFFLFFSYLQTLQAREYTGATPVIEGMEEFDEFIYDSEASKASKVGGGGGHVYEPLVALTAHMRRLADAQRVALRVAVERVEVCV